MIPSLGSAPVQQAAHIAARSSCTCIETFTQTEALLFTLVNGKVAEIQDFFADIALSDRLFS